MNKLGWGLRVELGIILLFLICLLISTIGLNRLGLLGDNTDSLIDGNNNSYSYSTLEEKLESSTKKYITEYYNNDIEGDAIIIKYSTLYNNGYIKKLVDENNKECSGYTQIIKTSGALLYYPYIKCSNNYTTSGYDERNDW